MTMQARRQVWKRTGNAEDPARARNVCTSAVVERMTGPEHLKGRYLHTGEDVRRALRDFGYSVRSIKTLAERQVRCKSGLKVRQAERLYDRGLLGGSCRPGEVLVGIVWGVHRHTGCRFLNLPVTDTAYSPGATCKTLFGVYASEEAAAEVPFAVQNAGGWLA